MKINETSEFYRPTGARGSLLFFQLMSLCRLAEDLEMQMFSLPFLGFFEVLDFEICRYKLRAACGQLQLQIAHLEDTRILFVLDV